MKVFLKKTVIFGFIIMMFCVGLELLLLTKPNVYSYKRKYVESHLNDISFLLMGNSHIEEALIPELLCDSSFNFAISAKGWQCDVELAERYIPQMNNLKIVVMPFSYQYFELARTVGGKDVLNPTERKKANNTYKCMQTKYLHVKQYGFRYWSEILYSGENYMGRLKLNKDSRDFCDSLGFVKLSVENRAENWKEQRVPGRFDPTKKRDENAFEKFVQGHETLAELCKEQGAELVLVSAPVYRTYQEAISDVIVQEMRDLADSLNSKYHNIEYYNFLFAEGFEDDDFKDAGHLTETGAIKFSKMLADSLFSNSNGEERSFQP